jgi:wyosine [tRNA(Phe)-imidazoG37] synthetase (radical SAM superfamily)
VITFSGSGEPTLAKNLGEIIEKIKELTHKPIVILTNSTLLYQPKVRKELAQADKIFCKLDAWSEETLSRFDHPKKEVSLEKIINGIHHLRQEFNGFLAIQTMILRPLKEFEFEEYADILRLIKPDEVQLNLPSRPIPQKYFLETRGNEVEFDETFTKLKTISKDDLELIRKKIAKLTNLPIITR